ncbi:MAG: hypothetical protein IT371_20165 [Deltaproteobacteria bacterium]|nr:hypothetical protein [Deltaproteobacteria bacterium]
MNAYYTEDIRRMANDVAGCIEAPTGQMNFVVALLAAAAEVLPQAHPEWELIQRAHNALLAKAGVLEATRALLLSKEEILRLFPALASCPAST